MSTGTLVGAWAIMGSPKGTPEAPRQGQPAISSGKHEGQPPFSIVSYDLKKGNRSSSKGEGGENQ